MQSIKHIVTYNLLCNKITVQVSLIGRESYKMQSIIYIMTYWLLFKKKVSLIGKEKQIKL